jgi:hypothetical protein
MMGNALPRGVRGGRRAAGEAAGRADSARARADVRIASADLILGCVGLGAALARSGEPVGRQLGAFLVMTAVAAVAQGIYGHRRGGPSVPADRRSAGVLPQGSLTVAMHAAVVMLGILTFSTPAAAAGVAMGLGPGRLLGHAASTRWPDSTYWR